MFRRSQKPVPHASELMSVAELFGRRFERTRPKNPAVHNRLDRQRGRNGAKAIEASRESELSNLTPRL